MRRLLVEVFLPAVGETYDLSLPADESLSVVCETAVQAFCELDKDRFAAGSLMLLCDGYSGEILDGSASAAELGLQNGSRLMLL